MGHLPVLVGQDLFPNQPGKYRRGGIPGGSTEITEGEEHPKIGGRGFRNSALGMDVEIGGQWRSYLEKMEGGRSGVLINTLARWARTGSL